MSSAIAQLTFYAGEMDEAQCPRCLELEARELQQRLAAVGQFVTCSTGASPYPNVEAELQRWLRVAPHADAAAGFRAGWARLARLVGPKLTEWEMSWWRAVRDNDRLRSRIGS